MKKYNWIAISLVVLFLAACTAPEPGEVSEEGYMNISIETLKTMLDERPDSFLLVNTHIPFEGNLPTTDFSVPYNEINQHLDLFPADKDAEIVLYCMSNRMALIAADDLLTAGYTNLKLLEGGMLAWQRAGQTLDIEP